MTEDKYMTGAEELPKYRMYSEFELLTMYNNYLENPKTLLDMTYENQVLLLRSINQVLGIKPLQNKPL